VLLIVASVLIAVIAAAAVAARIRSRGGTAVDELRSDPGDLQERVRELSTRGRKIEAIKVLRDQIPGLGLKAAKRAAEAIESGHSLETALANAGHRRPPISDVPGDLQERVRELSMRGQKIEAIKLLRRQIPALGLRQARDLAEALEAGPALSPGSPVGAVRPARTHDLADRIRVLKVDGRIEQAVFLVRGETGMRHAEATAFVESIQPESDAI
jgi:ribosomal protein L7/L12